MAFRAAYQSHAIDEVAFRVVLGAPLNSESIKAVVDNRSRFNDLPLVELLPNIEIEIVQNAFGQPQPIPREAGLIGLTLTATKRDATPEWQFRIHGNLIEVKCREYTRWKNIWKKAATYITAAISCLGMSPMDAVAVNLQYIDRFLWDGPEADYTLSELLREDCPYIPAPIFSVGPLWHLNQGWFEPRQLHDERGGKSRLLKRMNLQGARVADRLTVTIDQISQLNFGTRQNLTAVFNIGAVGQDVATELFDGLHHLNKRLVLDLVNEKVCESVGLRKSESDMSEFSREIAG